MALVEVFVVFNGGCFGWPVWLPGGIRVWFGCGSWCELIWRLWDGGGPTAQQLWSCLGLMLSLYFLLLSPWLNFFAVALPSLLVELLWIECVDSISWCSISSILGFNSSVAAPFVWSLLVLSLASYREN